MMVLMMMMMMMMMLFQAVVEKAMSWDRNGDGLIENSGFADQTFDAWVMAGSRFVHTSSPSSPSQLTPSVWSARGIGMSCPVLPCTHRALSAVRSLLAKRSVSGCHGLGMVWAPPVQETKGQMSWQNRVQRLSSLKPVSRIKYQEKKTIIKLKATVKPRVEKDDNHTLSREEQVVHSYDVCYVGLA